MHESHTSRRSVILPKRLAEFTPLARSRHATAPLSDGQEIRTLSERIGALPGVETRCTLLADGAATSDYFIQPEFVLSHACGTSQLMCHIDADGILLPFVDDADRAEVLHKGWALPADGALTLYPPRNASETEIAWRVVLSMYQHLTLRPVQSGVMRNNAPIFPKYSSTAKYWT